MRERRGQQLRRPRVLAGEQPVGEVQRRAPRTARRRRRGRRTTPPTSGWRTTSPAARRGRCPRPRARPGWRTGGPPPGPAAPSAGAQRRPGRVVEGGDADPVVGGAVQPVAAAFQPYCSASGRCRSPRCAPSGVIHAVEVCSRWAYRIDVRTNWPSPVRSRSISASMMPERRQQAVAGVAERGARPDRPAAVVETAVQPAGAAEGGAGLVVARVLLPRALLVADGVAVDQPRVDLLERLVVDAEPLGGGVAHVVLDDVGLLDQPLEHRQSGRVLEVEGDRLLVPVAHLRDVVASTRTSRSASSTLITRAPSWASIWVPNGPATATPEVEHRDALQRATTAAGRPAPPAPGHRRGSAGRPPRAPRRCAGRGPAPDAGAGCGCCSRSTTRPTCRTAPNSGSGTSTTQPSSTSSGSSSASSGERTGCSGVPTCAATRTHSATGCLRDRLDHLVVEVEEHDHVVRRGRDPVGRLLRRRDRGQRLHAGLVGVDDELRQRHPVVQPAPVGAAEEAARGPRVGDPGEEVLDLRVLDLHPGSGRGDHDALEQAWRRPAGRGR